LKYIIKKIIEKTAPTGIAIRKNNKYSSSGELDPPTLEYNERITNAERPDIAIHRTARQKYNLGIVFLFNNHRVIKSKVMVKRM
jgi:hypothetical protein